MKPFVQMLKDLSNKIIAIHTMVMHTMVNHIMVIHTMVNKESFINSFIMQNVKALKIKVVFMP